MNIFNKFNILLNLIEKETCSIPSYFIINSNDGIKLNNNIFLRNRLIDNSSKIKFMNRYCNIPIVITSAVPPNKIYAIQETAYGNKEWEIECTFD